MQTRRDMHDLRAGAARVEVEWIDSSHQGDWQDEDDVIRDFEREDSLLCCSIGYVLHEEDEKLVITQSFSTSGGRSRHVKGALAIPKAAIRDIKELRR